MSLSLKADIEKAVADSKRIQSEDFAQECCGLTALEILNLYRNRYYQEGMNTEHGIVAAAINEVLPVHTRFLKAQREAYEGKFNEAIKRILK